MSMPCTSLGPRAKRRRLDFLQLGWGSDVAPQGVTDSYVPPQIAMKGFSLIELMVSMVIGLVATLAITAVMINSEGSRRSSTSVNDINQTGSYTAFVLDRSLRSAGSGFAQQPGIYGCLLDAAKSLTTILPLPTAVAAPFSSMPLNVRLAPALIGSGLAGGGGDVLVVMSGTSGSGDSPQSILTGSVTSSGYRLTNALSYSKDDLVLVGDGSIAAGCMVQQVSGVISDEVTLGGDYYREVGKATLTAFGDGTTTGSWSMQLGSWGAGRENPPKFEMFAVNSTDNALYGLDLLQISSSAPVALAEGIVEMRARYGLDTTSPGAAGLRDGILDSWTTPTGSYAYSSLTDGSSASQIRLRNIVSIRVGLILRTSVQEKEDVYQANTDLKLFSDLGASLEAKRTITTGTTAAKFRYRTIEFTVPLRNVIYAPAS
jgi:type IV pilus assembly protein PilW